MEITIASCKKLLLEAGINPASTVEYKVNDELKTVTLEWMIEAFMNASEETRTLFFTSLKKIAATGNGLALKEYFENMGKLLILSSSPQSAG